MKYPYYNPNLNIGTVFKAFFFSTKRAEIKIKNYFSKLTWKKYILITNSCRTALYLAYKAIDMEGEVITSPLTCKVAIDPIVESGNNPVFADINIGDLNIKPDDIEHRITPKTMAIQAIHLGGVSCDMDFISQVAKRNNLWVIEDCAQSLGATYKNNTTGTFGDIACFSLIKNAYGIGGGILATNNQKVFQKALEINKKLQTTNRLIIVFRIVRNAIETKRRYFWGRILYTFLMKAKGSKSSYETVTKQLKKIAPIQIKINALQISRLKKLNNKRKSIGRNYFERLNKKGYLVNNNYEPEDSSFTKFYIYNPHINTNAFLNKLHAVGIEAMHLEHKTNSPYQPQLVDEAKARKQQLNNYLKTHDHIISLPLQENFSEKDINFIIDSIV